MMQLPAGIALPYELFKFQDMFYQKNNTKNAEDLYVFMYSMLYQGFLGGSEVKVSAWNAGDPGLIPGLGRSPGEGNGNPLHTPTCQQKFAYNRKKCF